MKTAHDPNGIMRHAVDGMIAVRMRADLFITSHPLPFV
jgi:hypothetical protein